MLKPQGYVTVVAPDTPLLERDTITCRHCQAIVWVKPGSAATVYLQTAIDGTVREAPGAFCRRCMAPVCLRCDTGRCTPWERRLERIEARARLLRAVGVGLLVALFGGASSSAQFIAGDKLTGTAPPPPVGEGIIFSENFEDPNPPGAACTDCYHFTTKRGRTDNPCDNQGTNYPTPGSCPVSPQWGYSVITGPQGGDDNAVELWRAYATGGFAVGYEIDLPGDVETANEVYWGVMTQVRTQTGEARWDTPGPGDTNSNMNKFVIFGESGTSRVICPIAAPQDNYNYLLSGSCSGQASLCLPASWGITGVGTDWHHVDINNKYASIGCGWGIAEEGVGPGLVGYAGLTGVPASGWTCTMFYIKSGTVGVWEMRMWHGPVGTTYTFDGYTSRHVGGVGAFENRDLGDGSWNSIWTLGGYVEQGIATPDYRWAIDNFWIGSQFRPNACNP